MIKWVASTSKSLTFSGGAIPDKHARIDFLGMLTKSSAKTRQYFKFKYPLVPKSSAKTVRQRFITLQ